MISGKKEDNSLGNRSLKKINEQKIEVHVTSNKQINNNACASVMESITTIILPIMLDMIPVNIPSSNARKCNRQPTHIPIITEIPIDSSRE